MLDKEVDVDLVVEAVVAGDKMGVNTFFDTELELVRAIDADNDGTGFFEELAGPQLP